MELTKEYFDQQLSQLPTKGDLQRIDKRIDALPTQTDLERFATKDDLLELATKNDLRSVHSDIAEIKELVKRIDEREDQDTRAVMRDVTDLHRRVAALEKRPS